MDLSFYPMDMPCEFDFTISRGTTTSVRNLFVELHYVDAAGKAWTGMGEAVPCDFYGQSLDSITRFFEEIQRSGLLDGLSPFDIQKFNEAMLSYTGNHTGRAALEMAMYDLMGQICGQPLYRLLGLDGSKPLRSSYTIGIAEPDMVRHKTQVALDRGYNILKIKVGGPHDLETLKIIREMAPQAAIRVDANCAWTPDEAIAMFPTLAQYQVEFVEEPLRTDIAGPDRRRVKEASPLPLLADESVHVLQDIPKIAPWFHGINLKLVKTGGLWEAMRMIHSARAHGMFIMLGCFPESSLSITAFAHIGPLVDYLDLDGGLLLANDPVEGVRWEGSRMFLPDKPGLGIVKKAEVFSA